MEKIDGKTFIKLNIILINKLNINDIITNEKGDLIIKLYNKIYKSIENSENINVNYINHLLLNNTKDSDIELFKKFIKIKNIYTIKKIIHSNDFNIFIKKLSGELDIKYNKNIHEILTKGIYKLLIKTSDQFRGCWEIVDYNNNTIKIKIIEPEHIEYIKKYIKIKLSK